MNAIEILTADRDEWKRRALAAEESANGRDYYLHLWNESCRAVVEICDMIGTHPDAMKDLWTLKDSISDLKRRAEKAEAKIGFMLNGFGPEDGNHNDV